MVVGVRRVLVKKKGICSKCLKSLQRIKHKDIADCKNWKSIKPIRTNLIVEGCDLTALGACVDGGLPAFGGSV